MRCGASPWSRGLRIAGMVVLGVFAAVVFGLVFGFVVQALWNWLMPSVFGLKTVTYWQAFGLVLLSRLLVGSMGHSEKHGPSHGPGKHFHHKWERDDCGWESRDDWKEWRFYDEWWGEEGKAAFGRYVVRKKGESGEGDLKE